MSVNFRRKKAGAPGKDNFTIDYKELGVLKGYLTETGKIVPSRITGATNSMQRKVSKSIKLARFLALLPYCDSHR